MRNLEFKEQLHDYSQWRGQLIQALEMYLEWRNRYGLSDPHSQDIILNMINGLRSDRIMLAFAAEFSRGKTELINSLFFAETGMRLFPSSPGRTTMCPVELLYDTEGGDYIRLLNIESRLEDRTLAEYKQNADCWKQIDLDCNSPAQMQRAFTELAAVKEVPYDQAQKLGLINEHESANRDDNDAVKVEIPCWRHAMVSFPHPLLKQGLSILDTPGLNALGAEPELTLSMLPGAQAIIFVLAADTGVTKSDLEMWRNHVCRATGNSKQGLAVVMNKIDSMWDDLTGEGGYEQAIESQVQKSASILDLDENLIFPVSAKQGLLAKVKEDEALLDKSRVASLENYLSEEILDQRRKILKETVERNIGFLVQESANLTNSKLINAARQLDEFKKVDFDNEEMTGKLLAETRDQQNTYMANVASFQASRRVFTIQTKMLTDSISKHKIDEIIKSTRQDMLKSLTTYGIKQNIRRLFDELRDLLEDAIDITNETRRLVKAIHRKFQDEYGFKEIEPKLFSIKQYQFELELLFEEGDAFRRSTKTTMTEQSIVVHKLYSTIIAKARNILKQAHEDATVWSNSVLTPLMHQIKDQKLQIENRLKMLRKISGSKGDVTGNIEKLEQELEPLRHQRNELMMIMKNMQLNEDVVESEKKEPLQVESYV